VRGELTSLTGNLKQIQRTTPPSCLAVEFSNFLSHTMAQNIYDSKVFFKEYIQLPRQTKGLAGAPEWPTLRAMLPASLTGAKFLDLGCGFGWASRWARKRGAAEVLGVDLSANMLAKAREFPADEGVAYLRADLNSLELPPNTFNVAFSSLTLHYLKDLPHLVAQVYQSLVGGGTFTFSVEHPLWTAPSSPAFIEDSQGRTVWPLDRYLDEGERTTHWLADGVVKQHRTLATYIRILLEAGFTLSAIDEWAPNEEDLIANPGWEKARIRPPFLLMKASKLV
jgi:SAM-dependent methyltransferase